MVSMYKALDKVWISGFSDCAWAKFFKVRIKPVLLYKSETWTLNCYTRLLLKAKKLYWKKHPYFSQIYGDLSPLASNLAQSRASFVGHCMKAENQAVSTILPWQLPQVEVLQHTRYCIYRYTEVNIRYLLWLC